MAIHFLTGMGSVAQPQRCTLAMNRTLLHCTRMPKPALDPATASSNALVVEAFFAALERIDVDAAMALMSEDVAYQNVKTPMVHGKSRVAPYLGAIMSSVTEFEVVDCVYREDGDTIEVERIDLARGGGLDLRLEATGTFRLRDGEITQWVDTFRWTDIGAAMLRSAPSMAMSRLRGLREWVVGG